MNEIIIRLKGEIQDSNFDEWRIGLINQIKAADRNLSIDADFIQADELVKGFKEAEKSLVQTKKEALAQAADITALFKSIDEVSAECRTTRLNLERQIKKRKEEIHGGLLNSAAKQIRDCILDQDEDYQLVAPEMFKPMDLQAVIKHRRTIETMELALDEYTFNVQGQIAIRAQEIKAAAEILSDLPEDRAHLFHDRKALLSMSGQELQATATSRIAAAEASEAKRREKEAEARAAKEKREAEASIIAERQKADQAVENARQQAINDERDRLFREADEKLQRDLDEHERNKAKTKITDAAPVRSGATAPVEPEPVSNWVIRIYFSDTQDSAQTLTKYLNEVVDNATITLDTV